MAAGLRRSKPGTTRVRTIVRQEVSKASEALAGPVSDESVHEARKELKKVRAALRLLRPALGPRAYRRENAGFRDAARPLTEVRDAKVMVDTLDKLAEQFEGELDARTFDDLRRVLREQQREVYRRVLEEKAELDAAREFLDTARQRVKRWPVGRRGWSVLGAGLKRVYQSGREAFAEAQRYPSMENLHEWRKQVKYLWHQLQLLRPLHPAVLRGEAEQAHALADHLGDDHDLAVLRQQLHDDRERFPDRAAAHKVLTLIDRRRAKLQKQAWSAGRHLYVEKPKRFADRHGAYWRAWRAGAPALV